MNFMPWTAAMTLLCACMMAPAGAQQISTYSGPCDASAAVALDAEHFVVGDDEHNTLHVYRRGQPHAVAKFPLSKFLKTRANEESDIEGAARIDSRIYWITSHGRDSHGMASRSRHRFFAIEIVPGQPPTLKPLNKPYTHLIRDINEADALRPYELGGAAHLAAEAEGGFNIEGLAATPDGQLLIGLRNPVPQGRALLIPMQNPSEVIKGQRARFAAPVELDLGQRGIRSIELVGSSYLIAAGPPADEGSFALYRWSGQRGATATPVDGVDLMGLRPEALFAIPQTATVQLLSDDGGVKIDGIECKKRPLAEQTFRSLVLTP